MSLRNTLDYFDKERASVARDLNRQQATTKTLPLELLLKIFALLLPSGDGFMGRRNSRSSNKKDHPTADLRRTTQVCSLWRKVALESPSLWSRNLDCNKESLAWFTELLQRCQSAPVHLIADFCQVRFLHTWYSDMADKLEMVVALSPNIGSLSMVYNGGNLREPLSNLLNIVISMSTSATRLSFCVDMKLIPPQWRSTRHSLPSLSNQQLRQLEVEGCWPDLSLPCFGQLTWLSVSYVSELTAKDWVQALVGLPELKHLRLKEAMSSISASRGFHGHIKFPNLKTLTLIGKFDDGLGEFLLAVEPTQRYSLFLHCTLVKNSNVDLLVCGLRRWLAVWNTNLPPEVGQRRIDLMASCSRFRLHNQIPGTNLSDEWFRIYFNWKSINSPERLRKIQTEIFDLFQPVLKQTHTLCIVTDGICEGFVCCPSFWQHFQAVKILRFTSRDLGECSTTAGFIKAMCNDIGMLIIHEATFMDLMLPRISRADYGNQANVIPSCDIIRG